ncbi:MAG: hypothetical protein Q9P14_00100 [candidate division KSB1 bacterium]|nr:hypothetical protein [candidate division KSB1 bacterium]MDQ7062843.1 hypothetical protein [candidate division KSB1 bacterium]
MAPRAQDRFFACAIHYVSGYPMHRTMLSFININIKFHRKAIVFSSVTVLFAGAPAAANIGDDPFGHAEKKDWEWTCIKRSTPYLW